MSTDALAKVSVDAIVGPMRACTAHGEYPTSLVVVGERRVLASECPKCAEIYRALREKENAAARLSALPELRKAAAIPKRFAGKTLADFQVSGLIDGHAMARKNAHAVASRYVKRFDEVIKTGASLTFCGTFGTGKTLLACAIANEVIEQHQRSALYTTALNAVRRIKDTWRGGDHVSETEKEAIRAFVKPDLLVLDEVGVQFGSDTEKLLLFDILNGRYEDVKPTIVISNQDVNGMEAYLGARVMDRLKEGGGMVVPFEWKSYREAGE